MFIGFYDGKGYPQRMRLYRWLKILQIWRSQVGGGGNPHLFYLQTTKDVTKRCIRLYLEYKSTDFFPEGKTGVDRFLPHPYPKLNQLFCLECGL